MTAFTVSDYEYGRHASQHVRLFLPRGSGLPVAVVLHGGFWRVGNGIELAEPLAEDLTRFGLAAAAVEYRRVGDGGGWPGTLADVARAVDALATSGQAAAEGRLDLKHVAAVGHSAGGQLAVWLTHRRRLRVGTAGSITAQTHHVPLVGAVSQGGVLDLVAASDEGLGNGAANALMQGEARSVPQRYDHASPLAHVGDGARVVAVHGEDDTVVPPRQSQAYVEAAVAAGDPATLILLPGVGHMELIEVGHLAWEACRSAVFQMV